MNFLYSVRFRLFALCISLLVVLGGANLILGSINQQHEAQVLQLQEQYRRVSVIFSVHQAMVRYRYWQGQLNDAMLFSNKEEEKVAESKLDQARMLLDDRFVELGQFDAAAVIVLRATLVELRLALREAITAMVQHDSMAEHRVGKATVLVGTIEETLKASARSQQAAAEKLEQLAREHAAIGERVSAVIIVVSSGLGLLLTFVVLNSIIRPMQATVKALRMVNAGEESIDLPPVGKDEFGDMAVALRQFRDQAERLRRLAYIDPLTGLGNRVRLEESVNEAIGGGNQKCSALFFIDIDNFRSVNESLGHSVGDRYLGEAVARLHRFVPDEALVCRYAGDKFAVLVSEIPGWDADTLQAHLRRLATNVLQGMAEPVQLDNDLLPMSVSIGISVFPSDGQSTEQLISSAEAAMYLAKRQGRNNVQFANPALMGDARRQLATVTEIRRGLENREFEPFYQPVVNVETGAIVGAEALLRWRHPQRGVVSAADFIPAAEASGLIHTLGELCMVKACEHAAAWHEDGKEIRISVNLSARQIEDRSAVALLERLHANGTGAGARALDFEITETALLQHLDHVQQTLKDIQAMGHRLSVDDFGTGYSSLVYLQRFPVNRIKIDKSFVARMTTSREAAAIVSATIALARSLDLEVVAEGVENLEQLNRLRAQGCVLQQGFYFTPALPVADFNKWQASRLTGAVALT